jgi:hypothetical protein
MRQAIVMNRIGRPINDLHARGRPSRRKTRIASDDREAVLTGNKAIEPIHPT